MSSSASTSKPVEPKKEKDKEEEKTEEKSQVNTLGLLEEDDEFEEFETAGMFKLSVVPLALI